MKNKFFPVCEPLLSGNEKKYVNEAVETSWISARGPFVEKFENMFAEYSGVKYATSVSNGTNAIHLALKALDIQEDDEVIIPTFTMICSVLPVLYLGAKPVFVDSEPITWNIDPQKIEDKITEKTKAIMVVHIYGHPCDMKPIWEIANKYNLKIIEDAAEAHGAEYFGKKCGNLGDIAAFSFFANKVVTTGEGGMVLTNNEELLKRSKCYKDLCFPQTGERTYIHEDIGFQYRFSNIQAAIGVAQIEKIDEYINMRRNNNSLYREYLGAIDGINFQPELEGNKNIYWMNAALSDPTKLEIDRDTIMVRLGEKGIQTRKFFVPMHQQPTLKKYVNPDEKFPVADLIAENGIIFPSSSGLKEEEIKYICECIIEVIK